MDSFGNLEHISVLKESKRIFKVKKFEYIDNSERVE